MSGLILAWKFIHIFDFGLNLFGMDDSDIFCIVYAKKNNDGKSS